MYVSELVYVALRGGIKGGRRGRSALLAFKRTYMYIKTHTHSLSLPYTHRYTLPPPLPFITTTTHLDVLLPHHTRNITPTPPSGSHVISPNSPTFVPPPERAAYLNVLLAGVAEEGGTTHMHTFTHLHATHKIQRSDVYTHHHPSLIHTHTWMLSHLDVLLPGVAQEGGHRRGVPRAHRHVQGGVAVRCRV